MTGVLISVAFITRALTKVYDKYLITTNNFDSDIYAVITRGYSILFILILLPFVWADLSVTSFSLLAMVAGFFKFCSLVFFFRCLKKSDAAISVGLKQSFGFIIPLIYFSTIDKSNTLLILLNIPVAMAIVFFLLNNNTLKKYFGISKSNFLILVSSCALEFAYIGIISLNTKESFIWLFCWSRLGSFLSALLYLAVFKRLERLKSLSSITNIYTDVKIGVNEIVSLASKLSIIYLLTSPTLKNGFALNTKFYAPILVILFLSILALTRKDIYEKLTITSFHDIKFTYIGLFLMLIFQASLAI